MQEESKNVAPTEGVKRSVYSSLFNKKEEQHATTD